MTIDFTFHFSYEFWKEHISTKRRVDILKINDKRDLRAWLKSCFKHAIASVPLHESLTINNRMSCDFWSINKNGYCTIHFRREPLSHLSLREIRQIIIENFKKIFEHVNEFKLDEIHNEANFVPGSFNYYVKLSNPTTATWIFRDILIRNSVERDFEDQHFSDEDRGDY
jgi:hypothetical protein